ncbi:Similar to FPV018: Putative ankyrin repeat protein FPV018 (Fowlpox virus (strain NVSL)) [Cotesia congregata]|uniref:Similar to FPV018: Putative ankyrin repeat protein FPV018 (Fowlpox virus (Strain NVSL)) n=1 Tax=Cotesia congregata TaxID=51543 RepID=A0A8J2HEH3_COTCN|nr:Similar to FPV018: Putative ankyrin repeat protein FPV018 (Fowlpox virus (strain NVSL)) [Cotesia congregata]
MSVKIFCISSSEKNFFEYTILHLALYEDDDEFIDVLLLENNADTKLETEHLAAVILSAIRLNRLKYVKKLVTAGADVNQIICVDDTHEKKSSRHNDEGDPHIYHIDYTPLEFAVNLNAYKITEFLISQGADVHGRYDNDGGDSPMGIAATSNNVEMMKLLIKHGAGINAGDEYGITPLMKAAIESNNSASRRLLLSQPFIEINSLTEDMRSCLHFSTIWTDIDVPESSLQDLLDAGCDVNVVSKHGRLPIDSYEDKEMCFEIMKKHIVELIAAGFYVCDRKKLFQKVN